MAEDNSQYSDDFTPGFVVKDPSGKYRTVPADQTLDLDTDDQKNVPADTPRPAPPAAARTAPPPQNIPSSTSPTPKSPPPAPPAQPPRKPLTPQPPVQELGEKEGEFMDSEDEAEIKKHAAALERMVTQSAAPVPDTAEAVAEDLTKKYNLQFANDVLRKRFIKVVESRLRNVRNSVETNDVLTRPEKIGGLDLSDDQAQKIIDDLEQHTSEMGRGASPQPEKESKPSAAETSPADAMLSAAPPAFVPRPTGSQTTPASADAQPAPSAGDDPAALAQQIKKEMETAPTPPSTPPAPPQPQKETAAAPPTPPPATPPQSTEPHELYGQSDTAMPRIRPVQKDKPHMVDIRQPAQAVGPVEEIHQIDLQEFRRMGTNPNESADKIKEKIELLEEESWEMRVSAVQAWKQSPVFQLYVAIGREGMKNNKSINEVIRNRQSQEQPHLLPEEFFAINQLNMTMAI